eukprot:350755-Chlamydomonas_euryale.AAC.6
MCAQRPACCAEGVPAAEPHVGPRARWRAAGSAHPGCSSPPFHRPAVCGVPGVDALVRAPGLGTPFTAAPHTHRMRRAVRICSDAHLLRHKLSGRLLDVHVTPMWHLREAHLTAR